MIDANELLSLVKYGAKDTFGIDLISVASPVWFAGYTSGITYEGDVVAWVSRSVFDAHRVGPSTIEKGSRGLFETARALTRAQTTVDVAAVFAYAFIADRLSEIGRRDAWRGETFILLHKMAAELSQITGYQYHHRSCTLLPITATCPYTAPPQNQYELAHMIAVDIALTAWGFQLISVETEVNR